MKKINLFTLIVYLSFFIITLKLLSMQIINKNYYYEKLESRTNKIVYGNTSLRGRIYDTNHNLLVDNKLVMTIIYQKEKEISKEEEIDLAYNISKYLELDYNKLSDSYLKDYYILTNEKEVNKRIKKDLDDYNNHLISNKELYQKKKKCVTDDDLKKYSYDDRKAIYLYFLMTNGYSYDEKIIKEDCSIEEFMYFSENNYQLHGFDTKYSYGRVYVHPDSLRSVLGSVGKISEENKDYYLAHGYELNDQVGVSALEYMYEDYLKGERALYKIVNGEKILLEEEKRGNDLVLNIDIKLQKIVDDILIDEVKKAKNSYNANYYRHSYVLISDTKGNVLAMAGKEINNNKISDVSIGNIRDAMAPGSAIKGVSMLVGYDTKSIKMGEVMLDECLKIKSTPKKCSVYKMGYINDIKALAYSSNVYQFKTAIKVGKGVYHYNEPLKINEEAFDIYRNYFNRFGLGVKTGIDLPKEETGYKGTSKTAGLLLDYAIGQYDTYTNIELNQYISTIAQNGNRYKMQLVKEIIDNSNQVIMNYEPILLNDVNIPLEYINRVKEGLKAVIDYGSGKNYTNLKASGKTGTSESFYDSDFDGKIDKETISTSFVMFYPSDNPKIAISIISPNISLQNSNYKYPINQNVIKKISNYFS